MKNDIFDANNISSSNMLEISMGCRKVFSQKMPVAYCFINCALMQISRRRLQHKKTSAGFSCRLMCLVLGSTFRH